MGDEVARLTSAGAWIWDRIRSAPVTCVWLVILLMTTILQHSMSPKHLNHVLGHQSTNIVNLQKDPFQVLLASLFWLDGSYWFPYLILFCIFLIPAERWLGTARFVVVGLSAHVVATYVSEGLLRRAIASGDASADLIRIHDVGVSYFLAAVAAVLAYHIARPWRWVYIAGCVVIYLVPLLTHITVTNIGHACSALIGFAWYPLTRGLGGQQWDPMVVLRAIRQYLGSRRRSQCSE
ncbi:rhomboid-like protein [Gordonia polyisoprenivorans]|uniref:rhomboid-like protein n=1 Tax=Gordonia polyisoprenivorans TaxID=84595 RepID=UPI001AD7AEE7|nr:rhomboid-like protein [Gordonia polyisoprenivorans]QTI70321.1 hypothetical protein J6U32_07060 [Gordonia polyisoprenivorans]